MVSVSEKELELIYWHKFPEWYTKRQENGETVFEIKTDAPERIKKSFEEWQKQKND